MNNILNIVLASVSVIGAFGGLVWLEKELRLMTTTDVSSWVAGDVVYYI